MSYSCLICNQPIPDGEVWTYRQKPYCVKDAPTEATHWRDGTNVATGPAITTPARLVNPASGTASAVLTALGITCLLVGFNYLLFNPTNPDDYGLARDTVNFHRLFVGQTFTVVGAIFCAVAWRPR